MRKWKQACSLALAAALLAGTMLMPAYGATRKKIKSVSLDVESEIELDSKYGDESISVDVRSGNCSYDYYEIENDGFEWSEDIVPEITIYLRANEGYYFSLSKASQVKINGATYVKASKQDSSETLALRVKLPSMAESVGQETEVKLTDGGYAMWDEIRGAGSYELRLYRDGQGIGSSYQTTDKLYYDYTSQMKKAGSYQVKVRAVNKQNTKNKGKWMESPAITITAAMAEAIRNGTAPGMPLKGSWQTDGTRWWYVHEDGSQTKGGWEQIDNKWYLFDADGYMRTGWVEVDGKKFYLDEKDGEMLKSTTTPDGVRLDANGNPANS